jgi:hypothetical protein
MLSHSLINVDPQVLNADMLSTLIERNAGNIIDEISTEKAANYLSLKQRLHETDVTEDKVFQKDFVKWASIRGRKFTKEKKQLLFQFLEESKHQEKFPFREAYRAIFATTSKRFSNNHFRTLTYMASLVDPQYPIFNQKIAELYRYKAKRGVTQTKQDKFSAFLRFYRYVRETYSEMMTAENLRAPLIALKVVLGQNGVRLPLEKRLDLLIRGTAELKAEEGLVRVPIAS